MEISVPNPKYLLWSHIMQKGFQAGSVLGFLAAVPVLLFRNRSAGMSPAAQKEGVLTILALSGLFGTAAIGAVGGARLYQLDSEGVADRGFRIHNNAGQQRVDMFSQVSGLLGGVGGAIAFGTSAAHVAGGASAGCAVGVLAHVATMAKHEGRNHKLDEPKTD